MIDLSFDLATKEDLHHKVKCTSSVRESTSWQNAKDERPKLISASRIPGKLKRLTGCCVQKTDGSKSCNQVGKHDRELLMSCPKRFSLEDCLRVYVRYTVLL